MQGETQMRVEGLVMSRELRNGRLYFDLSTGEEVYACFDLNGELEPLSVYPGRPVRCVGRPSLAVKGYFEVERLEHCIEHIASRAFQFRQDALVRLFGDARDGQTVVAR